MLTLAMYLVIFYLYISIGRGIIYFMSGIEKTSCDECYKEVMLLWPIILLMVGIGVLILIVIFDINYMINLINNLIKNKSKILPDYYEG